MAAVRIYLPLEMYTSKAFMALSGVSLQVLIIIMSKRRMEPPPKPKKGGKRGRDWVCTNPDDLSLTYVEAKSKYGITYPRLNRAIADLLGKGFLRVTHQGGGYRCDKSTYSLSERYQQWKPGMVMEARQMDPVTRGFRKPKMPEKSLCILHREKNQHTKT